MTRILTFVAAATLLSSPLQAPPSLQTAQQAVSSGVKVTGLALEGKHLGSWAFVLGPPSAGTRAETAELLFMVPDHYRSTVVSSDAVQYRGFSRGLPLLGAKSLSPGTRIGYGDPDAVPFVARERAVAARLLLGMLGIIDGPLPLEAVAGPRAGVLHITGPNQFDAFVDLDQTTGMPLRVRYTEMRGFTPPVTPGQKEVRSGPPEPAEITIAFTDRRRVNGVMIPHRMTRTARSVATGQHETLDEYTFEKVAINPPLTVADFARGV